MPTIFILSAVEEQAGGSLPSTDVIQAPGCRLAARCFRFPLFTSIGKEVPCR